MIGFASGHLEVYCVHVEYFHVNCFVLLFEPLSFDPDHGDNAPIPPQWQASWSLTNHVCDLLNHRGSAQQSDYQKNELAAVKFLDRCIENTVS